MVDSAGHQLRMTFLAKMLSVFAGIQLHGGEPMVVPYS